MNPKVADNAARTYRRLRAEGWTHHGAAVARALVVQEGLREAGEDDTEAARIVDDLFALTHDEAPLLLQLLGEHFRGRRVILDRLYLLSSS